MVDFSSLLNLQIQIFTFMFVGYLFHKLKIINATARKSLTNIVVYFVLPCNIIYSFLIEMNAQIIKSCIIIFLVSIGIQIACEIVSRFLYPTANREQQKVLKYATICSNAGFMGSPLVQGIYGLQGLLYASVYLIPQRIIMWSSGIACFSDANRKDVFKKVVTHPCIIAVVIGVVLMMTQVALPAFLVTTIASASQATTLLSMLVIGSILAEINIKEVLSHLSIYFTCLRLIVIPLVVLAVCVLLRLPSLVIAVSVVLAGMPAGTTTAILAEQYDGDTALSVQIIFLSTAFSLVTIPALCLLMEAFIG